jgi:HAD superfamily hydrolase (TIGR01459 family)
MQKNRMPDKQSNAPIISHLCDIAANYDVIFSDVWGVVHNGLIPHAAAGVALTEFRKSGGVVVMISNAPRPAWSVVEQLNTIGVVSSAYDAVVTSGDVTQSLARAMPDPHCFHIGAQKDEPLFRDLAVKRVPKEKASFIICSGLKDDETETVADYTDLLADLRKRGLPMICANPDLVVERGEKLILCAGALADVYQEMGGKVTHAGKPHQPIYEATHAKATGILGKTPEKSRILAIGDAIRTDVAGAKAFGIDSLFLSAGIHTSELHGGDGRLSPAQLNAFMPKQAFQPMATSEYLVW